MLKPAAAESQNVDANPPDDIIQTLDQQALPEFISSLTDKGKIHRFHLVHVEGDLRDPRASVYLMQAYTEADSEGVRCKLLQSLGQLHDPKLLLWFSQRLKDAHPSIQCFAIWALGELKTAKSIALLWPELGSTNPFVRMTTIDALGKTGKDARVAAELERFLDDEDVQVRFLAAKALRGVAAEDSTSVLVEHLQQEASLDVQEVLAKTLGHVGGAVALGRLIELLKNQPSPVTEHWVAMALTSAESRQVIPALRPLLESDDLHLKVVAAHILKDIELQARGTEQ